MQQLHNCQNRRMEDEVDEISKKKGSRSRIYGERTEYLCLNEGTAATNSERRVGTWRCKPRISLVGLTAGHVLADHSSGARSDWSGHCSCNVT